MDVSQLEFHSPTMGILDLAGVVREIVRFVEKDPQEFYEIAVGTDSEQNLNEVDFIRAIVCHRSHQGGIYFWNRLLVPKKMVLRERIYQEATLSLELAEILLEQMHLGELTKIQKNNGHVNFVIHVDIGPVGPTREMIAEITGMIRGSGYEVKTKPEAYGASNVADRYT